MDAAQTEEDEARSKEWPKKVDRQQPGPAKNVGDDTANPLPDNTEQGPEWGGDPGRT
jgi:hypothetical protein